MSVLQNLHCTHCDRYISKIKPNPIIVCADCFKKGFRNNFREGVGFTTATDLRHVKLNPRFLGSTRTELDFGFHSSKAQFRVGISPSSIVHRNKLSSSANAKL